MKCLWDDHVKWISWKQHAEFQCNQVSPADALPHFEFPIGTNWVSGDLWDKCNADNPPQEATDQQQRRCSIVLVPLRSPKHITTLHPHDCCILSGLWRWLCVKITVDQWLVSTDIQINVSIRRFQAKGSNWSGMVSVICSITGFDAVANLISMGWRHPEWVLLLSELELQLELSLYCYTNNLFSSSTLAFSGKNEAGT